jgi:ribosome recycling factor
MKELVLVENDTKTFETAISAEMDKAIKHFEGELIKIRTGRAHVSMVEDLKIIVYGGQTMGLKAVATLGAPESDLITIQPWDASIIADIEKAILTSDLGVKPQSDGGIIRIQLPKMSTSRREELAKILGKKAEDCKIAIRNIRKDFNNIIRDAKKDKTISENFFNRLEDLLQKNTDNFTKKTDVMSEKKNVELTSI